jgi:hypothetical protein
LKKIEGPQGNNEKYGYNRNCEVQKQKFEYRLLGFEFNHIA